MKNILFAFLFVGQLTYGQENPVSQLFVVQHNNKLGAINAWGQLVIPAVFENIAGFSEGLAPARVSGLYGYIDANGNWQINPQFDYALPFEDSIAIVFRKEKPFYIGRDGQVLFDHSYKDLDYFEKGLAKVQTHSGKQGLIDKKGELRLDTIFEDITKAGTIGYIVEKFKEDEDQEDAFAVVDSHGKELIPFGKYKRISPCENGLFKAEVPAEPWDSIHGYSAKTVFVDKQDKILVSLDKKKGFFDGEPHCGMIPLVLYKSRFDTSGTHVSPNDSCQGYMNLQGEVVMSDTSWKWLDAFSENRAFVQGQEGYLLLDLRGKIISDSIFSSRWEGGFQQGAAFVKVEDKWGMIDTNGHFMIPPRFDDVDPTGLHDSIFFFQEHEYTADGEYSALSGIASRNGTVLFPALMRWYHHGGFRDGLLLCLVDDTLRYINKQGKVVWQDSSMKNAKNQRLNIDYMNRGYFYASSEPDKYDLGGHGGSENRPISSYNSKLFSPGILSVVVRPDDIDTIAGQYLGLKVYLVNNSKKKIQFQAQDSRLYMKVQALNSSGEWRDIEYLPSSWCGNSYHTLTLPRHHMWTFVTPMYDGDFRTKLRIAVTYLNLDFKEQKNRIKNQRDIPPSPPPPRYREKRTVTIYSNEYEGAVNPGQFWRKPGYTPAGLMDPYWD